MLQEGKLGVHPPGALGVAYFVHGAADCFIGRGGGGITQALKQTGFLKLLDQERVRTVSLKRRIFSNMLEADALDCLPELVLVCCNPDQLGEFTAEATRFVENLVERGRLHCLDDIRRFVPILLILPNGILSELTLDMYQEQLNESMLMGRLPGFDREMVDALLARVVRGISLQAGGRRGCGPDATYLLERKGTMLFAGGGEAERLRIENILGEHRYPFTHVSGVPGTRIEFDKAMISIVINVGGLIHTIKPDGELIDLRMGDLCKDASKAEFVHRVTKAVFDVGQTIGAYPSDLTYEKTWEKHHATIMAHAGHVTSSLKSFRDALNDGLDTVKLFPNEEWVLTPLARYATSAGLAEEEQLFKSLRQQVQHVMAKAIKYRKDNQNSKHARAKKMNLTAQRHISVEAYESGSEDMVLVGTMLDNEHLIKLELKVHLPDEQITHSELKMIRSPFPVCREVECAADRLVGLRIERGVISEIGSRVGGSVGCSHIKELATNIVYFVASYLVRRRVGIDPLTTDYVEKSPEERFRLTKDLLKDSCLAYCQATAQGLDERIGIRRVGQEHTNPVPLGDYEPSLGVLLQDRVERLGDAVYIRSRTTGGKSSLTWKEFGQTTFQISRHLIELGIRPGDRICMLSENRAEMFMFELACMSIGAVTVPIFAGYPAAQVGYVVGHSRPRVMVVSGMHQLDKIDRKSFDWIEKFYCMDANKRSFEWGAMGFSELTVPGGANQDRLDRRIKEVRPDDLCMVMYTSGTTGPPKGVKLCHRNIISQQKAISLIWDVSSKDIFLSYLPWHHSFGGLFERFMTLYNGCELCLDDSRGRDIERLTENWKLFKPTLFFSVPRVHEALLSHCRTHPEIQQLVFGGPLRFVFTAGAPLPAKVEAVYKEHHIPVLEGWGLTETSPCVTCTTLDGQWQSGYVGRPIPGVKVRIDNNQEILVKGPNVMLGYLDDEEATSHVIGEDGWFRTGDLGEFARDGLRILGRKDRTFKLTNGEKVHPLRIENLLVNESSYIGLSVVLGSGQDYVGALIYPDLSCLNEWGREQGVTGSDWLRHPTTQELLADEVTRINEKIEVKYQRVRRFVVIDNPPTLENGELTPSGKLVRNAVVNHHRQKIEALFSPEKSSEVIDVPYEAGRPAVCKV